MRRHPRIPILSVGGSYHLHLAAFMCALGCWWGLPGSACAAWNQPVASPLNVDAAGDSFDPSITSVGGTPYVAWDETTGSARQVHVDQLIGSGWSAVGGTLNIDPTKLAELPSLADVGGVPYAVWDEKDGGKYQVHVAEFTGGEWNLVGGPLNVDPNDDAGSASIANVGGVPYVAWEETSGATPSQIRVARLTGGTWTVVAGSLNVDATKQAINPRIASVAGTPYVAWQESVGTHFDVYVKQLSPGGWSLVGGGPLNVDPTQPAEFPSVTDVGGIPYIAWQEGSSSASHVDVARFMGGSWSAVGGAVNLDPTKDAGAPSITSADGVPFVAFNDASSGPSQIHVAEFKNGAWTTIGGALNNDPTHNADLSAITMVGGTPYVAWQESTGSDSEVRAARLEPDISGETATPVATGATLSAQVNDYGVPLSVGFEYGTMPTFGTATSPLTTPGTGMSTVTQTVSGLTPATSYFYRAFGSDTFRETSLGGTESFTTLTLGTPTPRVSRLRASVSTFSRCAQPTKKSGHRRCRSTPRLRVRYTLNVAASVTITLARRAAGRKVHGRCVKATKQDRKHPGCMRLIRLRGKITRSGAPGANRITINGKFAGHRLRAGAYRLIVTPTGGLSKATTFTIQRR
jgi:hypothetical protein